MIVPTSRQADSIKAVALSTANDTIRMAAFYDLANYYLDFNADSSAWFVKKEIAIAQQLNLKMWEAEGKDLYSVTLSNMGNWAGAFQTLREAFDLLEAKDLLQNTWRLEKFSVSGTPESGVASISLLCQMDLSNLYRHSGDFNKFRSVAFDCIKKAKAINDQSILAILCMNLGSMNLSLRNVDSTTFYYQESVKYALACNYFQYISSAYNGLGEINYLQGNLPQARSWYNKAIEAASGLKNSIAVGAAMVNIAKLLKKQGYRDSAYYFARQSIQIYQALNLDNPIVSAYRTMAEVFESSHQYDSAYFYLSLASAVKDSLQTTENSRQFQNLEFNEQTRQQELANEKQKSQTRLRMYGLIAGLAAIAAIAGILYWSNVRKRKTNIVLNKTLQNLKSAQAQLIQSEKMASLGELTAGIAHEIQNPLNFVNNFSEVNNELIEEVKSKKSKVKSEELDDLLNDIFQNNEKINHHGKRADAIVKGMLQHSRSSGGQKEPTNINALADEYLRLAYHGLRAKDKSFNATMKTDFDESIGNINIVPQDIGRVILNLITNAFYVVNEKKNQGLASYEPTVTVKTSKNPPPAGGGRGAEVLISVRDNGPGIPQKILDKIFQPFFTTKPTGQGTGLGLSLSYDIVKAHGGELKVDTKEGEGSEFIIQLPVG
ncbi:MAG TPA: ATP-binding protein [Chitinophagaceae bacterium]|nr:ATP-binding protein [Chitinophagaceae bacterium]